VTACLLLTAGTGAEGEVVPTVLLTLAFILVAAKLAGALVEWLGQPAVLGELAVGILLGNLALLGGPDLHGVRQGEAFVVLAELGAIVLLFQVGLESTVRDMLAVGGRAFLVACVGVITPMMLGFGVGAVLRPADSWMLHAFLGAMLSATSVGITARVLGDLGAVKTKAARIVLGAAVIDDVLGLVVLAVVSGVITAAATGTQLGVLDVVMICVKAVAFLAGAILVGGFLSPRVFFGARILKAKGVVQSLSLSFCFVLSYLAVRAGLAPIVGAFAAGLVLEELHFKDHVDRGERPLHESMESLTGLLVPIFFVRMGMLVDIGSFLHGDVLGFALLLTAAAILGKWACALAAPRGVSGLTIGLGMMPRGEVGLIFAAIGAQLTLGGRPVVDTGTYAAAVFMVVSTTLATPPALAWAIRRGEER